MDIEIEYSVDSDQWSEDKFDSEPTRKFTIDTNMLSNILRTFGDLKSNEFIHEIENVNL